MRNPDSLLALHYLNAILALILLIGAAPRLAAEADFPNVPIPVTNLTLRAEGTSQRFIAAHGRRGMVVGYTGESLEGWIYPFQIFHDFRVGFRAEGSSEVVPASGLIREVLVNPESVTRVYSTVNFTVKETVFVPLDLAGFVILYEVESPAPLHIVLRFQPDLNLMWPGSIGGQRFDWNEKRRAFLLNVWEAAKQYTALVGSPAVGRHSPPASYPEPSDVNGKLSLELDVPAGAGKARTVPLLVSLGLPGHYDAAATYAKLLEETPRLFAEDREHYRKLVASNLQVETPDSTTNLAYSWARIALEQAYVCNPHLGCGLVAGYGPSQATRRPDYAWFFGSDALGSLTYALAAAGDQDRAREAVRFVQKYQKKETGEVLHELSQSAGLIDWFKDYPYAYRHTDTGLAYIMACENLYRASGDVEFLRASWGSLRAAYNYLVSRIDPADGFITVPPGNWSGSEESFEKPEEQITKEIGLETGWVDAGESLARLAETMGDHELASEARRRAEKARASIQAKLWDAQHNCYFYGFTARGDLVKRQTQIINVSDPEKSALALDRLARANFTTDWGPRGLSDDDPRFLSAGYGGGGVWPVGTGTQAITFYHYHRPLQAYPFVRALADQTFLDSLGHLPEVFSAERYRRFAIPEQAFSSSAVITSLVRGLLGLEPDAPGKKLVWTPHLPANWPGVKLRNLKVGQSALNLEMEQSESQVKLTVESSGPPVDIEFSPEIPLGAKDLRASVNGRRVAVTPAEHAQDVHAEIKFRVEQRVELILRFEPGVGPHVPAMPLAIGDRSRGLRVLSSKLEGRTYRAEVEGRPGACAPFTISTPWQVRRVTGGQMTSRQGSEWRFEVTPTPESCGSGADPGAYQKWTFQVEFAQ